MLQNIRILPWRPCRNNYWFNTACFLVWVLLCLFESNESWGQVSSIAFPFSGPSELSGNAAFTSPLTGNGILLGPLTLRPHVGFAEVYTDNVFRTATNVQSDNAHVMSAGMQGQLLLPNRHRFVADYRTSLLFFQKFSANDVQSQQATGRWSFQNSYGLTLDFQGGHTRGFIPRGSGLDIQTAQPTIWNTNAVIGQIEMLGAWAGARVVGSMTRWNFENNGQGPVQDRLSNGADLTFFGSVTPKTFVLLNFGVSEEIYDQNKQLDSFSYRVNTGLQWNVTGKTSGEIQVGYQYLNFDRAPITLPAGSVLSTGGDKTDSLNVSGNLQWQVTPKLGVSLSPFRRIQQSAVFNSTVSIQTGGAMNASLILGARTNGTLNYSFMDDRFESPITVGGSSQNRSDQLHTIGLGINYRAFQWIGVNVSYTWEQRDSSVAQFGFSSNTFSLAIEGVL